MMDDLPEKQRAILEFMRAFVEQHDYPPSIRDIQVGCGMSSTSVVDYNLKALQNRGYIRRDKEVSRAIVIEGARRQRSTPVPIIGQIAAGQPIPVPSADTWSSLAQAETIEVSPELTGNREGLYALRVKGTSMIDALINDGDIVVMEAASSADDGEMVAVWLKREGEVTLKKLYREGDRIRLQPANTTMGPIYTDANNVEVQGKVVLALRRT